MREASDPDGAFHLLQQHQSLFTPPPLRSQLLWRMARVQYDKNMRLPDDAKEDTRKEILKEAVAWAEQAVTEDKSNAEAHKWLAITLGAAAQLQPMKIKVEYSNKIRHHITEALRLNPQDAQSHHFLGRHSFRVRGSEFMWAREYQMIVIYVILHCLAERKSPWMST